MQYRTATDPVALLTACLAAIARPGALDTLVSAPHGIAPARVLVGMRAADTVIHTWDVCTGAGMDASLPSELMAAVDAVLPEPVLSRGRAIGAFGPPIKLADDADPQTVFLARYGRDATLYVR